jgi:hypothetical protein
MGELKTKEGELTDADLAEYGIPPKQHQGLEGQIGEQAKEVARNTLVEVSDEAPEKVVKPPSAEPSHTR